MSEIKKLLLAFAVITVVCFAGIAATMHVVHAQIGNPIAQVSSDPPKISVQVWAKAWKEEDCGKWYALAIAERQQKTPNTMLSMTDTNLFWACLEMNRHVNVAKEDNQFSR